MSYAPLDLERIHFLNNLNETNRTTTPTNKLNTSIKVILVPMEMLFQIGIEIFKGCES